MTDLTSTSGRFVLQDFQQKKVFSSFLPGIAGLKGIPMWVFYVNRGQAIAGFGVESKDHPLMEYQCAQRAYQLAAQFGFRTFLKGKRGSEVWTYEPFGAADCGQVKRSMTTGLNDLEIEEVNEKLGLKVNVLYFLLPNEPFAALVRRVTFTNLGTTPLKLEVLDGLPVICPFGIDDQTFKNMGRTIEAWMEVVNHVEGLPFFRIKASADDKLHVEEIKAGNFALAFQDGQQLAAMVDPQAVFGMDTAFNYPQKLVNSGLKSILEDFQVTQGRTPCAMFGTELELAEGKSKTINSYYGHASQLEVIKSQVSRLKKSDFMPGKIDEECQLACELTTPIHTESSSAIFDDYCSQTWLDNVMRGGMPLMLGGKHTYHIFSRRHGDLERDYNFFVVAPELYSQGNGSYRDINQNRRSDPYFFPKSGDFNIRLFMSLIQSDGYNPLTIQGSNFTLPADAVPALIKLAGKPQELQEVLSRHFTPGQVMTTALKSDLSISPDEFLEKVFAGAEQHIQAVHGEGYWSDHWSYNLDLVESYLNVYPENREFLLFDSAPLAFFDNATCINPRSKRYVLDGEAPRQFNVVYKDEEKAAMLAARNADGHWSCTRYGKGEVFKVPLVSKFALLALLKFAALDPSGYGVQMEGGKPGWYDALNGMPALFGSSMPDSYELMRLINFLVDLLGETGRKVKLPVELNKLINSIDQVLTGSPSPFSVWDELSAALEQYRELTRLGFDGACDEVDLSATFKSMQAYLQDGLKRSEIAAGELPATYFVHLPTKYEKTGQNDAFGRPIIHVTEFEAKPLPTFLEGPVRRLRTLDAEASGNLYQKLRTSALFDQKLNMFRLNASLESQPHMIGRARAFTPGWLENESIWMHMAFKLMLELLRKCMFEEFYNEFKIHVPAFMDPEVYGRSPLENSSFIASSAHPDPKLHGNGFVARLSGSTAEFLSMWVTMTAGQKPFSLDDGKLTLTMQPLLAGWLFKPDGTFKFKLMGSCDVTLHNPTRTDTYNIKPARISLRTSAGEAVNIEGNKITSPYAGMAREGKIVAMDVHY
ncbi:MAG TPA: cellobiose phosphorylase [Anaerolineaceae bacterium]|nr:cellobiose phosphorylase [Anaerolineaceae bacterium]